MWSRDRPGGGHEMAAGAMVHNKKEMKQLINDLESEIKKYESNNN